MERGSFVRRNITYKHRQFFPLLSHGNNFASKIPLWFQGLEDEGLCGQKQTQHNDSVTRKTEVFGFFFPFFGGGHVGNGEEPFGFTLTVKVAKPIYL